MIPITLISATLNLVCKAGYSTAALHSDVRTTNQGQAAMIDLPDCVTPGEIARLVPVTANFNKEQRTASILLAVFLGVHELLKIKLPKNYLKSVELYHWSGIYALTQATLLLEQEGVESEDQQFVLEEVHRYLMRYRQSLIISELWCAAPNARFAGGIA